MPMLRPKLRNCSVSSISPSSKRKPLRVLLRLPALVRLVPITPCKLTSELGLSGKIWDLNLNLASIGK